ncbi:RNA 2',3'-cyclic phosphodiesterase [Rhodohalobacter halophilus]|uniref:RNA 2',3'-cyclic phosphodiesterase n=1 Tax=Rhodohalobacter halophilus TaxID=1812810 RepID=UPI00083F9182|nr:RNA 2',3'-cyclic phosphodiesterase [Rhodohalobacter halophilus]
MNYFVCVSLPKRLQQKLGAILPDAQGWKKVKSNQIHLTLRFIGKMDNEELIKLRDDLSHVEFSPFYLALSEVRFFPQNKFPKVIWMGVEKSESLICLQNSVDDTVTGVIGRKSEHAFNPHITLARIKQQGITKQKVLGRLSSLPVGESFEVDQFYLVRSERDHQGATHHNVQQYDAKSGG